MEIAEQSDSEAFEPGGPATKGNFLAHDAGTVGLEQHRVGGECGHAGGRREADKLPPGRRKKRQSISGLYTAEWSGTQSLFVSITRLRGFAI